MYDNGRYIGSPKQINDRQFPPVHEMYFRVSAITIPGTSSQTQKGN